MTNSTSSLASATLTVWLSTPSPGGRDFENATNNGPITCTIRVADIGAGAAGHGLAAGEFDEFVRALRSGATYVNVHSTGRPGGEVRAQIEDDDRGRN